MNERTTKAAKISSIFMAGVLASSGYHAAKETPKLTRAEVFGPNAVVTEDFAGTDGKDSSKVFLVSTQEGPDGFKVINRVPKSLVGEK